MFIGKYELDNKIYNNIYYGHEGWREWHRDTFSVNSSNHEILDFKISGKTYQERKASLKDLAKDWQLHFSQFSWSYGELAEITDYFYENGKRYGLLKDFRENAIC